MVFLVCPKCGEMMNSNEPVNMMGFFDFTILPDGKIKVNRVWSTPKKESAQKIWKRTKPKRKQFEGTMKGTTREL